MNAPGFSSVLHGRVPRVPRPPKEAVRTPRTTAHRTALAAPSWPRCCHCGRRRRPGPAADPRRVPVRRGPARLPGPRPGPYGPAGDPGGTRWGAADDVRLDDPAHRHVPDASDGARLRPGAGGRRPPVPGDPAVGPDGTPCAVRGAGEQQDPGHVPLVLGRGVPEGGEAEAGATGTGECGTLVTVSTPRTASTPTPRAAVVPVLAGGVASALRLRRRRTAGDRGGIGAAPYRPFGSAAGDSRTVLTVHHNAAASPHFTWLFT